MLRQTKDLQNLAIGNVKGLYFDGESWTIRCLVVGTGSRLFSRKVLIPPIAAGRPDWTSMLLPVSLTRDQVRYSPDVIADCWSPDSTRPTLSTGWLHCADHQMAPMCRSVTYTPSAGGRPAPAFGH